MVVASIMIATYALVVLEFFFYVIGNMNNTEQQSNDCFSFLVKYINFEGIIYGAKRRDNFLRLKRCGYFNEVEIEQPLR